MTGNRGPQNELELYELADLDALGELDTDVDVDMMVEAVRTYCILCDWIYVRDNQVLFILHPHPSNKRSAVAIVGLINHLFACPSIVILVSFSELILYVSYSTCFYRR